MARPPHRLPHTWYVGLAPLTSENTSSPAACLPQAIPKRTGHWLNADVRLHFCPVSTVQPRLSNGPFRVPPRLLAFTSPPFGIACASLRRRGNSGPKGVSENPAAKSRGRTTFAPNPAQLTVHRVHRRRSITEKSSTRLLFQQCHVLREHSCLIRQTASARRSPSVTAIPTCQGSAHRRRRQAWR